MPSQVFNKAVYWILMCLSLSACSVLTQSDKAAVTTWWLVPYIGEAKVISPQTDLKVVSFEVTAVPGLDTNKILALTSELELKPYAGARWADHVPDIAESLLARSLAASGRFKVLEPGTVIPGEACSLRMEVREFFTRLNGADLTDRVTLSFVGQYQCGSNQVVPVNLSSSLPVQDGRMKNIVTSFQDAMDDVTRELLGVL